MGKKDIFVPFKCEVPLGSSTFEIQVPKTYLNRIFSFDNIMLISNLYAKQGQSFNEETEEELREILSYEIYIQAVFITEKKINSRTYLRDAYRSDNDRRLGQTDQHSL